MTTISLMTQKNVKALYVKKAKTKLPFELIEILPKKEQELKKVTIKSKPQSPRSLKNIIRDDYLIFEGIRRPLEVAFVRDSGAPSYIHSHASEEHVSKEDAKSTKDTERENRNIILAQYLTDVYNLFLQKLTSLVTINKLSEVEAKKLQSLLDEMIKVKGLIEQK